MIPIQMACIEPSLLMECRMALHLTQQQFGNLVGRSKRTIQRWEERATTLMPSEFEALARALYPVRRDLAEQIAAAADTTLERLGIGAAEGKGFVDPSASTASDRPARAAELRSSAILERHRSRALGHSGRRKPRREDLYEERVGRAPVR